MKKILLSMAALSALAIAAPAAAQYQNPNNQNVANGNVDLRIDQLQARLQAGVQSGAITRQEAVGLRQQLRQLNQLERQYSRNGLTGRERSDLQQRMRTLRQQIRTAEGGRGNSAGYGNGGYDDRGFGDLRVGQRVTRNLASLPSQYRSQFRDTNSTYFRTDGRSIFQIDARTATVVRIYQMNR